MFERIEAFFGRLEIYTEVAPTEGMVDTITAILVEVLNFLGIATKEMKQGRTSKCFLCKRVPGDKRIFRKICEETDGKEEYSVCAEETGQTDARRGSNGLRATSADHACHR